MERVKQHFISRHAEFLVDRIHVFTESSATAELAAQCLGCQPAMIAKSISFLVKVPTSKSENRKQQLEKAMMNRNKPDAGNGASGTDGSSSTASPTSPASPSQAQPSDYPILIVTAGDAKVNAKRYKEKFSCAPKMCKRETVEEVIGYPAGGVCPFGVNGNVQVYLDVSLKRFDTVYPAAGTGNTGIPLSCEELEKYASNVVEWVDLCEGWQDATEAPAAAAKADNEEAKKKEA